MVYAKLGETIRCVMNFIPGTMIEQPTEVKAVLSTPEAVGFANEELLPGGRWKLDGVPESGEMEIIYSDRER